MCPMHPRWQSSARQLMLVGLLAAATPATAQPLQAIRHMHHARWGPENGLPLIATTMLQTPDGYLWFSAAGGLVRFDGVRFTRIDGATSSLLRDDSGAPFR